MSDEDRQRQMDFILDQQALFAAQMQQSNTRLDRLERVVKLAVRAGLRTRREVREQLTALVDAQIKTEAATRRTDERINALIGVMERHVGDGHGGQGA